MDTATGEPGAVKSTPPPAADSGDDGEAVTSIRRAEPRSLEVAVANAARTRTAGGVPSARFFCSPDSSASVSAVSVTPRSSSVITNDAPSTSNPDAAPPISMLSAPSAIASPVINKPDNATAELIVEAAGMLTVTAVPGAPKSAASAPSPAVNDNVTSAAPVSVEEEAPVNRAVTDTAPALDAPSATAAWLSVNSIVSTMLRSAGLTVYPAADPVNRMTSAPSTVVSANGVITTSAAPSVAPDAIVTSTDAAPRS